MIVGWIMKNVLNVANFSGNRIKQGDKSLFRIKLLNGRFNEDIEELPAKVTLTSSDGKVVYKTDSIVIRECVDFTIDKTLPVGRYELEIVVDDRYVFPSDKKAMLNVTKNHKQELIEEIESVGLEAIADEVLGRVRQRDVTNYVHTQQVASVVWEITHNLGKYPAVTIVDSGGREVTGSVEHVSVNKVIIRFENAFSGTAYFN